MSDVWLVEHETQVSRRPPGFTGQIVALSPEAMNALDVAGITGFSTPIDYLPTPEHHALGLTCYDKAGAYIAQLDEWAQTWSALKATGLRPAFLNYYIFVILFSAIELRRAELIALLAAERPKRIFATPTIAEPLDHTLTFQRESAYIRVLETLWPDVRWLGDPTVPQPPAKSYPLRNWRNWRLLLQGVRKRWDGRARGPRNAPCALKLHVTPDLAQVIKYSSQADFRWVSWKPPYLTLTLDAQYPPVSHVTGETTSKDWPRSNVGVIDRRIEHFVWRIMPQMIYAAHQTDAVLKRDRIAIVVSGMPPATPEFRAIAGRARVQGVPFALMQHGGSYGYLTHPIHYWNDLAHCDLWLAYGQGVIDDLQRQFHDKPLPKMEAVGSPALSILQDRKPLRKRVPQTH